MMAFSDGNFNPKKFGVGDLVYYVDKRPMPSCYKVITYHPVHFGIVVGNCAKEIHVHRLVPADRRMVNGVKYKDFDVQTAPIMSSKEFDKWLKEHSGSYTPTPDAFCTESEFGEKYPLGERIKDREQLMADYKAGLLEKLNDVDQSYLDVECIMKGDFRLEKKRPWVDARVNGNKYREEGDLYIPFEDCFATYDEAQKCFDELKNKQREAAEMKEVMTDFTLGIKMVTDKLYTWQKLCNVSPIRVADVGKFLLDRKDMENIEVAIRGGELVWNTEERAPWMAVI